LEFDDVIYRIIWLRAGCSSGLVKQNNEVTASIEGGEFLDRVRDY
jgi:hypothetical protein